MKDYLASGVDLEAAAAAKSRIAAAARTTFNSRVLADIGHFGGFFALGEGPEGAVLVASADGVGTKLLLGVRLGLLTGLGRDLIHHCINDILVCGARPLFFLDYMAFGRLEPETAVVLAEGLAAACREHEVALIGGETAEMPDLYRAGEFDLAGTIVGSVQRSRIMDGSRVQDGDVLLGLASNGLHTNGYSLVRHVFAREIGDGSLHGRALGDGRSLAAALMEPHRCYLRAVSSILDEPGLHALAHVTGGGIEENTKRVLPNGLRPVVDWKIWQPPEIFRVIAEQGEVAEEEMRRVFNLGIGLVVVADRTAADDLAAKLEHQGERVIPVGWVAR
jgi:phosphoribosylformylglycinamidine cyclo-ligase